MATITENDIEPCCLRFERFGSEDTPAAALVFGQTTQDLSESHLPALADAIFSVVAIDEGA